MSGFRRKWRNFVIADVTCAVLNTGLVYYNWRADNQLFMWVSATSAIVMFGAAIHAYGRMRAS